MRKRLYNQSEKGKERLEQEARIIGSVAHPNIVQCIDWFGTTVPAFIVIARRTAVSCDPDISLAQPDSYTSGRESGKVLYIELSQHLV